MVTDGKCTCPPMWPKEHTGRHHPKCPDRGRGVPIAEELLSDEWLDEARADAEMNHSFSVIDTRRLFGHIAALTRALGAKP